MDPFAGGGSTCVVARALECPFVGGDKDDLTLGAHAALCKTVVSARKGPFVPYKVGALLSVWAKKRQLTEEAKEKAKVAKESKANGETAASTTDDDDNGGDEYNDVLHVCLEGGAFDAVLSGEKTDRGVSGGRTLLEVPSGREDIIIRIRRLLQVCSLLRPRGLVDAGSTDPPSSPHPSRTEHHFRCPALIPTDIPGVLWVRTGPFVLGALFLYICDFYYHLFLSIN